VTRAAVMQREPRRSTLRWASGYVVTAERAGNALLVMATIALIVAFCLPWWSLGVSPWGSGNSYVLVSSGFTGWGWLSLVAGLLALALTTRLVLARGTWLDKRMLALVTVVAGGVELLGNALFIAAARKTLIAIGEGQFASRGAGLNIATVAGSVLVASGLLLLSSQKRQRSPAESAAKTARLGTVLLAMATLALFVAFFLPWSSLKESVTRPPSLLVSNGFSSWGWLSFIAWLVMVAVAVSRFAVPPSAGDTRGKRVVNHLTALTTLAAGVTELIGNALFWVPKMTFSVGFGDYPIVGAGLVVAVSAGFVVIASGPLMVGPPKRRTPVLLRLLRSHIGGVGP
jgi:hypothetical protein